MRLGLGYSAFAICAACFYWDYKLGFESTKLYTTLAVIVYSIINAFLTYWIWGIEKGAVYNGTSPSGDKIQISSSTTKHEPRYKVVVKTTSKDGKAQEQRFENSFTSWFDGAGHFVAKPFQQMFARNVKVIGEADPVNAVKENKNKAPVSDGRTMDEKWASLLAESSGNSTAPIESETATTPSKGTKRRGKKA